MDRKSQILDRQKRMFRIAQDPTRYGLTIKIIAADSGLQYDSVRNYAAGETVMPLTALDALVDVLPDELLSLLLPTGHAIVTVPEGIDLDELDAVCRNIVAAKAAAHRSDSPAGPDISDCERVAILRAAAPLKAVA